MSDKELEKLYLKIADGTLSREETEAFFGHVTEKMFDERKNKLKFQMCNLNQ